MECGTEMAERVCGIQIEGERERTTSVYGIVVFVFFLSKFA